MNLSLSLSFPFEIVLGVPCKFQVDGRCFIYETEHIIEDNTSIITSQVHEAFLRAIFFGAFVTTARLFFFVIGRVLTRLDQYFKYLNCATVSVITAIEGPLSTPVRGHGGHFGNSALTRAQVPSIS